MRTVIRFALISGLLLLILSTLVVSTDEEAVILEVPHTTGLCVISMPPLVKAQDAQMQLPDRKGNCEQSLMVSVKRDVIMPAAHAYHDANGRILTAERYERSVYQLYHMETAAG